MMDTLTELRGCAHRDNLYARALAIIDAQAADLRCYEKTMAMIALGQPAPRADDALRDRALAFVKAIAEADRQSWNDATIDEAHAITALASEEPTGPVCTLCGLTLKGD